MQVMDLGLSGKIAVVTGSSRGLGLADMIDATASSRPHRASGELAFHVLDVMASVLEAAVEHRWLELTSGCERPAALPRSVSY